jgi:hypothetical protein
MSSPAAAVAATPTPTSSSSAVLRGPDVVLLAAAVDARPTPDWFTILSEAQRPRPRDATAAAALSRVLGRALHHAARHDRPEAVGLLLARGAHPDARADGGDVGGMAWEDDGDGSPPLLACAEWRRPARALLVGRASVAGGSGAAVLERAVRHGHLGLVRLLVEFGAEVDARSGVGWTALHVAAKMGLVAAAQVLVKDLGADIMARTARGETVEDVARRHEKGQFVEWMYLSGLVHPPAGSNAVVKRCHVEAFQAVYGM